MEQFTKYETARILGARALQIAMDAPLLVKIEKDQLEIIRYDPIKVAEIEFTSGVLPITVKRPLPKKIDTKLKREIVIEKKEDAAKKEKIEEKEITEEGEIMEMVKPEDETEETEEEPEGIEE